MDDSRVELGRQWEPLLLQRWGETWGLFLVVASAFLLLPQRTLHGVDGEVFLSWIEQGRHDYPRHVAYLHLVGAVHRLGAPHGLTALQSLLLTSAIGSALAAVFLHRTFRLLSPKPFRTGALPAFAAMATGPCLYYATCAEIHGVFAGGAAAAWWAFARLLLAPSRARVVVVGLATGAAASIHAFGHVLLPSLVAIAFVWGGPRRGLPTWWWTLAFAAHAAISTGIGFGLGAGVGGQASDAIGYCARHLSTFDVWTTPDVLFREWLLPCAPWSLVAVVGLFVRRARTWSLAALAALLLHLPATVLLLGHEHIDEGGAYLIAVVPAAVMAAVRLFRWREFCGLTVLGFAWAVSCVAPQWRPPVAPEFVVGVHELQREHPLALVVGRRHELDGVRIGVPGTIVVDLGAALHLWLEERQNGGTLTSWFDRWLSQFEAMDRPLLLSQTAVAFFATSTEPEVREFWDEFVPRTYTVVPQVRGGFAGVFVVRRPGGDR